MIRFFNSRQFYLSLSSLAADCFPAWDCGPSVSMVITGWSRHYCVSSSQSICYKLVYRKVIRKYCFIERPAPDTLDETLPVCQVLSLSYLNIFPSLETVVQMLISEGVSYLIGYDLCIAYHGIDVGV